MASILKSLKLLADPTRLRILLLLEREALSVAELQEILGMGQSRISTQLSQLKAENLVADQRSHRIIGVHFLADHADTLIGEGVMMVAGNMTLEQVAEAIHPHPTQTELFGDMARRLLSRLRRSEKAKAKAK